MQLLLLSSASNGFYQAYEFEKSPPASMYQIVEPDSIQKLQPTSIPLLLNVPMLQYRFSKRGDSPDEELKRFKNFRKIIRGQRW